jgi:GH25 family lysozyme M1 (1,4-beta-N-acetylmuramidase)
MKYAALVALIPLLSAVVAVPAPTLEKRAAPQGIDISHFQGTVNFNTVKANGVSFVYIKATEGTSTFDPTLSVTLNQLGRM